MTRSFISFIPHSELGTESAFALPDWYAPSSSGASENARIRPIFARRRQSKPQRRARTRARTTRPRCEGEDALRRGVINLF